MFGMKKLMEEIEDILSNQISAADRLEKLTFMLSEINDNLNNMYDRLEKWENTKSVEIGRKSVRKNKTKE